MNSISDDVHKPMNNKPSETQKNSIAPQNQEVSLSQKAYTALLFFEEGCQMENIRAFSIIHNLKDLVYDLQYTPENITDNEAEAIIREKGFKILFKTDLSIETIRENIMQAVFLKSLKLEELVNEQMSTSLKQNKIVLEESSEQTKKKTLQEQVENQNKAINQIMINVNINKLDKLMDLVGELVTSESMVTQNIDLKGLSLENFDKAARQLKKITSELQDTVMSIRMVPLSATFQKMNRLVRDMGKKLGKNVQLEILGEQTEVDKNIIENLADPLMHLIRNALDHGIEPAETRLSKGKEEIGKITLEAKNAGGDVLIIVKDDGRGLDREKILKKAKENNLVRRPESELTNRDIYSFIFLPGFSTKENVSEFSGRGVGMDVVSKNIGNINGSIGIDSIPDEGTTVTIKIPLTLAIIGGMNIRVGNSIYTIPTISIQESFRPKENDVFEDTDGNEMIMIRGQCYRIIRLHQLFGIRTEVTRLPEGILMMVESDKGTVCIFADALLGEQQVVVKALPGYIKKVKGLAGCTILGNGNISLILDVAQVVGFE
ncbi:MAG: chemotaxis protein CheA [Thermoclostridium sp.]|nr:chemotaxis protein CheA [Thermoclostridium sp.]